MTRKQKKYCNRPIECIRKHPVGGNGRNNTYQDLRNYCIDQFNERWNEFEHQLFILASHSANRE